MQRAWTEVHSSPVLLHAFSAFSWLRVVEKHMQKEAISRTEVH